MFSNLVGNTQAKHTLLRLITSGRLPNSLLFVGPGGVGKRQFALEAARTVLCRKKEAGEACGICSICTHIAEFVIPEPSDSTKDQFKHVFFGGSRDVGVVVPFRNFILVDASRDLEREVNFRPSDGVARFFIVDDADRMNENAANALLKTLEEPPPTSYIFLITSRPDSLLPTIRSRCQTLRFAPVGTQEIEDYLIHERALQHHEAALAARLARGSIGRAVHLNIEQFRTQRQRMFDVVRHAISTGDRAALLKISEELNDAKNKDAFPQNIDILESLIHDVWTCVASGERSRVSNTDLDDDIQRLAAEAAPHRLTEWLKLIEEMRL
ncbi:MAG TPA: DNA polymerase III subunit delta', partial [Pyrinomonadaceae bacterium]